jgi:hypothetical protein
VANLDRAEIGRTVGGVANLPDRDVLDQLPTSPLSKECKRTEESRSHKQGMAIDFARSTS